MLMEQVTGVLIPLIIHYTAGIFISMIPGEGDAAFLTTLTAVLVLPLFVWMMRKDGRQYGIQEKKNVHPFSWKSVIFVVILGVLSNQAVGMLVQLLITERGFSNAAQDSLFGSAFAAQLLGVGILIPVMEEVLFRGLIYQRLKRFLSIRISVLLGAFLFAAYHGNVIQFLFAFPMALLIIWCYERWGTIKAPILFHIAVNLSSVLLSKCLSS